MSFEWRTDEDDGWQESAKREETAVSQSFWQRRRRFLLVVLVGILSVWLVVQWQINQRVTAATVEIETELLNTHNFVLQTAVDRDEVLFKSNLSGRNPNWGEAQRTLLSEGLLLERPMLGWQYEAMPQPLRLEDVNIALDPDLQAAELTYPQTYAVLIPSGLTETVTLQQTAVYRLGERRWLYSPPYDEFWGDWITQGGDYLTLAYTERDRDVAARLAVDLDGLLGQMCAELDDLNCDSDLRVHLRLATDPESMLAVNEIDTMLTAGLRLELPTPTLMGLPADEAGYEVLYQAYGVKLATAVLAHQIEYDCCRHQLFFRALRDYQLAQLGLQAWPLSEAIYGQMLAAGIDGDVFRYWTQRWEEAPPQFVNLVEEPAPVWQQVYMLVEYLNELETAVSPIEMIRLMDGNNYDSWLSDILGDRYYVFETHFLEYIYVQAGGGKPTDLPIPLPSGTINLICDNAPDSRVFAFDLASDTWIERFAGQFTNTNINTHDGERFVFTEYAFAQPNNTFKFFLATADGVRLLEEAEFPSQSEHWINYVLIDEQGDYLLRFEYDEGELNLSYRQTECASADCPEISTDGWPLFSPDGQHLLVRVRPEQTSSSYFAYDLRYDLFVTSVDGQLRQPLGVGGFPFWLNNDVYGYVEDREADWALVTVNLSRNQPRVLLEEADLLAEVPAETRPGHVSINHAVVHPTDPWELLLQVRRSEVGASEGFNPEAPSYLFRLRLTDDLAAVAQIELLRTDSFSGVVGYSPDGRFIVIGRDDDNSPKTIWYLLDQETGQTSDPFITKGYNVTWSPDGQWFVQNTDRYLLLSAPAHDYQYFIPHGFDGCRQVILSGKE